MKLGEEILSRNIGKPDKYQLDKINRLAKRKLSEDEVFVFFDKLAGDMIIPERYMKLDLSLLNEFQKDALSGVSMLIDHSWSGFFGRPKAAIPYGRTFDAAIEPSDIPGETWALNANHYIVRGKTMDGISTDALIANIEDGTMFDTSIGWGASTYHCSICGNDIRDYQNCPHIPGREYKVNGVDLLCYVIAKPPGYLMENSLVFDGAYPTAGVMSKIDEQGEDACFLSIGAKDIKDFPGVPLINIYSSHSGKLVTMAKKVDIPKKTILVKEEIEMGDEVTTTVETTTEPEQLTSNVDLTTGFVQTVTTDNTLPYSTTTTGGTTTFIPDLPIVSGYTYAGIGNTISKPEFLTKERATEVLGKEMDADTILKLAKIGQTYREELIADTLAWGVRAMGNSFPMDSWKQMLSESSREIQAIKDFRDQFQKQAEEAIPANRQSVPVDKSGKNNQSISDEFYKA